jgi:hypothetical protein
MLNIGLVISTIVTLTGVDPRRAMTLFVFCVYVKVIPFSLKSNLPFIQIGTTLSLNRPVIISDKFHDPPVWITVWARYFLFPKLSKALSYLGCGYGTKYLMIVHMPSSISLRIRQSAL